MNPLAEFIHQRLGLEDRVARRFFIQSDRSDLDRRSPERVPHGEADGFDRINGAITTHQVQPIGSARLVAQRGQIEPLPVRPLKVGQRNRRANPGSLEWKQAHVAQAVGREHPQFESLGGGRSQLHRQVGISRPIRWQLRV
jgi:hypothetical protein